MQITVVARTTAGILLLAAALVSAVSPSLLSRVLAPLAGNIWLAPHSWLTMRIIIIASAAPGIMLIWWSTVARWFRTVDCHIAGISATRFIVGVLGIGFLLRLAAIFIFPSPLWADWEDYHRLAVNILHEGAYTTGEHLTAYFPPGWPYVLSRLYWLFGINPLVGYLANAVFGTLTILVTYHLARQVWNGTTARWSALILALFPSQILYVNLLCSDVLFTLLFTLALLCIVRSLGFARSSIWLAVIGGLCLGTATLVRPTPLLLPLALLLPLLWRPFRVRRLFGRWALIVLSTGLVTVPWIIRNHHAVGSTTISTNGGIDFYVGNCPSGHPHAELLTPADKPWAFMGNEAELSRRGFHYGWQCIQTDPVRFLYNGLRKIVFIVLSETGVFAYELSQAAKAKEPTPYSWYAVGVQAYYLVCMLLVVMGMWGRWRTSDRNPTQVSIVLWTIAYYLGLHVFFFGIGRFHYPLIPLLAGFAGYATKRFLTAGVD